jgi:hypothetical protein
MIELVKIQNELKCKKDQYNNFGRYYYRSAESILEAVKPLLNKNNCVLLMSDDITTAGDRVYIKATARIINKDGKELSNTALAREPLTQKGMSDPQITGSASSYARKYALNGLFAIDDTTDTDSQDNTVSTAIETIRKLIKTKKVNETDFLKYFGVDRVGALTYDQQQQALVMLQKK